MTRDVSETRRRASESVSSEPDAEQLSMTSGSVPSFYRPCWVEINIAALRHNVKTLLQRLAPETQLLAVVKADAYGHGALVAAKAALSEGAALLGVSSLEEGIHLRAAQIDAPILILGSIYPFESFSVLFEKRLTPTVASVEAAEALNRLALEHQQTLAVHLKIDSGFGRIGVSLPNALEFIMKVKSFGGLTIEGLYTHFASADVDPDYTRQQSRAFVEVVAAAKAQNVSPTYVHWANSSALIQYPETHGSLVRPGLALYGVPPFPGAERLVALEPVLTWKSRIIFLKTVAEGTPISYARTWTAKRPTRVATLAVGYADGLPRLLTNRGHVLIRGQRVPIIGRITMDMTMVDVTDVPECRVGDEVVLIGAQGDQRLGAQAMAADAQTSSYEILCGIGPRVPRITI